MQIDTQKVVTIEYTLKQDEGEVLDESPEGGFAYLHGAQNIIPGLEKELSGKAPGDQLSVTVGPDEAYGERDDRLVQTVPKDMFPEDAAVEPGSQFHAQTPDGQPIVLTVVDVQDDQVQVDANHPLAGMTLHFDVKVVDVRDASEEEISHGHAHGEGGHQH